MTSSQAPRRPPDGLPSRILPILARAVLLLLAALLLSALGLAWWFRSAARSALPQLDGEIHLPGLRSPVEVVRDFTGTPHIRAAALEDLFFAQGFVTAQDRMFQMDLARRNAAGELSEVLGSPLVRGENAARLLEQDKIQRYLQLRWAAENALRRASPSSRTFFDAYSRGVNAQLERSGGRLPIEFRILGYEPEPWQPLDSILVGMNISQQMNSQFWSEWRRDRIAQRLPRPLLDELYPNDSPRSRAPGEKPVSLPSLYPVTRMAFLVRGLACSANQDEPAEPAAAASNNWVVAGQFTTSGGPLLSNDMHLVHTLPGIWYQAHLTAGDFDVIGYTLPGIPFVIAGHNRRIAWGFTNLGPDVTDLYVESFNERGEYRAPSGWSRPEIRREVVRVKGRTDVVFDVEVTRHGPVITPILPEENRKLSLKWIIHEPIPQELPFLGINRAGSWPEFRAAFAGYVAPAMNLVYADIEGNIGYQATGKIPVRGSGNGLSPVDGSSGTSEWTGYVPWEEMPSVFNPPEGVLATANGRIAPRDSKYLFANQWVSGHRTQRIYAVLEQQIAAGRKVSPEHMLALQTDVYSDFDRFAAQEMARAVRRSPGASASAEHAARLLEGWDGLITPDSTAAGFVAAARRTLTRMILEPRLGKEWERYRWFGATDFWEQILSRKPSHWLPPAFSGYDALLLELVEQTARDGEVRGDLGRFAYGLRFPLRLNHPLFGAIPVLRRYSGPGVVPQRGNGDTVNQAGATFGPSQRLTVDLRNFDNSTSNIVTGQSGHIASPHYLDHFPHWLQGTTLPLLFSDQAVRASARHRLNLRPE